jgi:hypothetical protein
MTQYVVVWRETPSPAARLRTYTNPDDSPRSFPLSNLSPAPDIVLDSRSDLDDYLQSDSTETVAIPALLASSVLGWDSASA